LNFHHGFKSFLPGISIDSIVTALSLEKAVNKQIRYYSSGMKQRVKLAQSRNLFFLIRRSYCWMSLVPI
jgi:ABC-type multidrug transport system ATPase subunit